MPGDATNGAGVRQPLVQCHGLEIGFGERALLPAFDLSLGRGELWVVLGRNGAGKTAFLKTILGLCPPVSGRVEHPGAGSLRLSYASQRSALDELYPLTAINVVALGVERGWSFLRPRSRKEAARRALSLLDAERLAERPYRQLSEGERQRVLLARIAASDAELAFMDEPTSALDLVAERAVFRLMQTLTRETGVTLVVVTHSVRFAIECADRALLLDRDTPAVVSGTPREVLAHASFEQSFGTTIVEHRHV